MTEFGKTLHDAREAKGYSVSQLAEMTHILPQIIESLEREDFTRIVAPIYGRGFVKLYCEAVGIEAQPLVTEFMEIYNGNRPPVIRMRDDAADPVRAEAPTPPPIEEPPSVRAEPEPEPEPELFGGPVQKPVPPPFVEPAPPPPPSGEPEPEPLLAADEPEPVHKKFRDYRLPGYSMPEVPRRYWRFGVLGVATIVILALIFFSCRALYRATMTAPEPETPAIEEPQHSDATPAKAPEKAKTPETAKVPEKARAPRKPITVPPLYID